MIFLLPLFPPSLGLASFPGRLMGSVPQTRSTALTQTQESWCLQRGISVGRGSRVWLWERWGAPREGPVNVVRTGAGDARWTRWEGLPGRRDSRPQSTHTPAAESCQTVACFVGSRRRRGRGSWQPNRKSSGRRTEHFRPQGAMEGFRAGEGLGHIFTLSHAGEGEWSQGEKAEAAGEAGRAFWVPSLHQAGGLGHQRISGVKSTG